MGLVLRWSEAGLPGTCSVSGLGSAKLLGRCASWVGHQSETHLGTLGHLVPLIDFAAEEAFSSPVVIATLSVLEERHLGIHKLFVNSCMTGPSGFGYALLLIPYFRYCVDVDSELVSMDAWIPYHPASQHVGSYALNASP